MNVKSFFSGIVKAYAIPGVKDTHLCKNCGYRYGLHGAIQHECRVKHKGGLLFDDKRTFEGLSSGGKER